MSKTIALVLGGGRGTRLYPLTKYRSKPAVPLAGKYRLIDIPLSNCLNSGINRIYVLTQFMSVSLHRHIRQTYRFDHFCGGFVELLAAQQTIDASTDWYQGTADAVRKNLRYLQQPGIEHVLILSGDQLYRMDFQEMLKTHAASGAEVSIAALPVSRQVAASVGIMRADDRGRVIGFVEKPQTDAELKDVILDPQWLRKQGIESPGRDCLASMGIYLFNRDALVDVLESTHVEDFGRQLFPQSIERHHVQTHLFDGYWEDIGTIKAFFDANLSLVNPNPPFELVVPNAPVYSRARFLPPTRVARATVHRSLLADGCTIGEGAVIENSIIGLRCTIGPHVTIRNSILMGADYYEDDLALWTDQKDGVPPIGIGAGSHIEGAIIDKNCHIGRDVRIINESGIQDSGGEGVWMIRDGIPVVTKGGALPDGWRPSS
jgi:glucose-1-phosphate adenylyltransferase